MDAMNFILNWILGENNESFSFLMLKISCLLWVALFTDISVGLRDFSSLDILSLVEVIIKSYKVKILTIKLHR